MSLTLTRSKGESVTIKDQAGQTVGVILVTAVRDGRVRLAFNMNGPRERWTVLRSEVIVEASEGIPGGGA